VEKYMWYIYHSDRSLFPTISILTQLLLLIFALDKARTRRDHQKAVAAIMILQFHEMPVPVFRQISMSSLQNTLLEMLFLSTSKRKSIWRP
jgi:hypothetical protein